MMKKKRSSKSRRKNHKSLNAYGGTHPHYKTLKVQLRFEDDVTCGWNGKNPIYNKGKQIQKVY